MAISSPRPLNNYFQEPTRNITLKVETECENNNPSMLSGKQERPKIIVKIKLPLLKQASETKHQYDKKSKVKARRKKKVEASATETSANKIVKKTTEKREPESKLKQSSIKAHFQVRRSGRRPKSTLKTEKHDKFLQKILDEDESGLEVRVLPEKGRGIFAAKDFKKGDLVCEYAGELIDYTLGLQREREYSQNPDFGCYSYFFEYKNKKYCVDATKESGRLGRLLNHCRTSKNVCTQVFPIKDIPRLILVASKNIKTGEELVYDYGERNKQAVENHPWLKM